MLAVKGILRLAHSQVCGEVACLSRRPHRVGEVEVGNSGKLNGQIMARCSFVTNRGRNNPNVSWANVVLHGTRCSDTNEGVCTDSNEFLHRNRRRWAANTG